MTRENNRTGKGMYMLPSTPVSTEKKEPHITEFSVKFNAPDDKELHQSIEEFLGQTSTQFSAIPIVGMVTMLLIATLVEFITGNILSGVLCLIASAMPIIHLVGHPMWGVRTHVHDLMKTPKEELFSNRQWCREAISIQANIYHHGLFGWVYAAIALMLALMLFVLPANPFSAVLILLFGSYVVAVNYTVTKAARDVVQGTAFSLWQGEDCVL
jgi:hypothetical protein